MKIGNFDLTKNVFVIAELSANHNGSFETAIETIHAAKRAGADCIKLQTYTADTITLKSNKPDFMLSNGTIWDGHYLHDLYQKAYTPWGWHKKLFEVARSIGLEVFSSPFDHSAVDFLEELDVPAYKIASFEITDIPLISYAASKMKPIIMSTGVAEKKDIERAIQACKNVGNDQIILLKCTSSYPAPPEEANLTMIRDFQTRYGFISGLSDHTLGTAAPTVAVCMGGKVIEKHFILNKDVGGPDASFSLDESEFAEMVKAVRNAELMIGEISYTLTPKQKSGRYYARSLYISKNVKAGDVVSEENIRSVRPGNGMHPKFYHEVIGKNFIEDFELGDPLSMDKIK
jgi:pseudaminic acid synthase